MVFKNIRIVGIGGSEKCHNRKRKENRDKTTKCKIYSVTPNMPKFKKKRKPPEMLITSQASAISMSVSVFMLDNLRGCCSCPDGAGSVVDS